MFGSRTASVGTRPSFNTSRSSTVARQDVAAALKFSPAVACPVTIANELRDEALIPEEAHLWDLLAQLLYDSEITSSGQYSPEAIGLESVCPHRRSWFVSHQAFLQGLVLRDVALRHRCIVLRWLEQTTPALALHNVVSAETTTERALLLRRIWRLIRQGQFRSAISAAECAADGVMASYLQCVELKTVAEPWLNKTATVPLFGEYTCGESTAPWADNRFRIQALSAMHDLSHETMINDPSDTDIITLEKSIFAALCGDFELLKAQIAQWSSCTVTPTPLTRRRDHPASEEYGFERLG